jgi:uncharacterized OsmC-like protein
LIDLQPIATAFERIANMFRDDPERGRHTAVSRARIEQGLTCHIEEGPWKLVADLSDKAGGARQGPTPGVLGRAALGSCIAIGYVLEAARAGVPIASVEVEVQADFDDGALFGVSDSPPGYTDVRYEISVCSDAPEQDLQRVAEVSDSRSPYVDVFTRGQSVHRSLRVVRPSQ